MSRGMEAFKIWAPQESIWITWAKPVLFQGITGEPKNIDLPTVPWAGSLETDMMVIIDMPGKTGVLEGLGLTRYGYRPVPLYNGAPTMYPMGSIVDTTEIVTALLDGEVILKEAYNLKAESPPAFLLDSNRMCRRSTVQENLYDNRWSIFMQDMPSAQFLKDKGIRKIVLSADVVEIDIGDILKEYYDAGIKVFLSDDTSAKLEELFPEKPSFFDRIKGWLFGDERATRPRWHRRRNSRPVYRPRTYYSGYGGAKSYGGSYVRLG